MGSGVGGGQGYPQCSLFSPSLRHLGPGPAPQSQRLAFSLDSPHGLSVRLAQSQQPQPLITGGGWGGGGGSCRLKFRLDTALGTMASCIYPQITKVAFSASSGEIVTSDLPRSAR